MTLLIFANGDLNNVAWIRPHLENATAIIAADGGSRYLWRLGQRPDIVIGDMDSLPINVADWLEKLHVRRAQSPRMKNETDLELCLLHAVENYDQENILIFAALGGRLDQTIANILLLAHPAFRERNIQLLTQFERTWLITEKAEIDGRVGDIVSFIPLGGDAEVVQTSGLQWALHQERLAYGPARGVSNVMTSNQASIQLASGQVLCIHTQQEWRR